MPSRLQQILIICLGGFWLLDGILQFQPAMFTNAFVTSVLAPNLAGQPGAIASIVAFGIRIWNLSPAWFNLAAALVQIVIGAMLIIPVWSGRRRNNEGAINVDITRYRDNTIRFALWLSVVWALIIWIFGEGFGSLATGMATFYTGAPGSALLYAILALFILDALNESGNGHGAPSDAPSNAPLRKLPATAGILFLLGAALNFAPMFWRMQSVFVNLLAVGALACLGLLLILVRARHSRPVAWVTIIFLIAVWGLGQSFGGLATFPGSTATDPNSAPVLALFLLPIFF
jgi:hypothetical protein